MQSLRDAAIAHGPLVRALGGLGVGLLFGALVMRTNFCTMGALSDLVSFGDWRRFRSWMLAIAVAIAGTAAFAAAGVVDIGKSMYLAPRLDWVGHIVGGGLFGFGMVFAGGCASRNLARAGAGDLRSLLVLVVLGLFAFIALGGLLGPLRDWLTNATALNLAPRKMEGQGAGQILAALTGLRAGPLSLAVAAVVALGLVGYCFRDAEFRGSPVHVAAGIGVGLCVVAGWTVTGLAYDELAAQVVSPISLTYVRPTGDALDWLERFTAGPMPGFGVASVFGALMGAFLVAKATGRFQIATFADKGDTLRNLLGAVLMGVGGVMALGCTVGQGITGISTLALGSFLTLAAIIAGGVVGLKTLERVLLAE